MNQIIYMLDTNVLCDWRIARSPRLMAEKGFVKAKKVKMNRIKAFCENNENRIYIPDLVWVEFLSVMLHKTIDVSGNLASTRQWVRNQESMVQQIEGMIENAPHLEWFVWDSGISPYPDAAILLRDPGLITFKELWWMKEKAYKSYVREENKGKQKLLDGMDSVILIYLNKLAIENKEDTVVLYTADNPMCRVLPRIQECHKDWFRQNTGAADALSNTIRCPECDRFSPPDILRQRRPSCQKCGAVLSFRF